MIKIHNLTNLKYIANVILKTWRFTKCKFLWCTTSKILTERSRSLELSQYFRAEQWLAIFIVKISIWMNTSPIRSVLLMCQPYQALPCPIEHSSFMSQDHSAIQWLFRASFPFARACLLYAVILPEQEAKQMTKIQTQHKPKCIKKTDLKVLNLVAMGVW